MKKTGKGVFVYKVINTAALPVIGIERHRIEIDGHGIRTLIGLSGCPLRCKYCLNPHAWDTPQNSEVFFSPKQLYEIVCIDSLYFQATNGGITFGGGEPLLHTAAIAQFKSFCPTEWSICAETSLNVPESKIPQTAEIFDHFIVDIKTIDPDIYRKYTTGDFSVMYANLKKLCTLISPEKISVRIPIIPGYTAEADQQRATAEIAALGITDIELFQYRTNIRK